MDYKDTGCEFIGQKLYIDATTEQEIIDFKKHWKDFFKEVLKDNLKSTPNCNIIVDCNDPYR